MNIRTPFNYISRKLLYLLVKTDIYPSSLEQLDIDPELPIVYVLDARAWSSLLVLETECQRLSLPSPLNRINSPLLANWHSVYTIAPRQPFKAWLKKLPKRSRMIRGLVEVVRENPEQIIQFIPVSVIWGRSVAKQKHWLSVLFSDSWDLAGRTRKLLTILFHGHSTQVHFSEVIRFNYDNIQEKSDDELIDSIQLQLSDRHIELRKTILGPDVSHRRTLVRKLLLKPDVQGAILKRSQEDSRSEYKTTLQARRYLNEIVADCTNITIQIMQRGLTSFWNKFYSGIEVSNHQYLKKLALTHELVYVPCHRSHIDYLLLSYVIYFEGLAMPYVAAGKNLNMPVIGSILRSGGAFFIRRSFKGNELYSTVMFEYMAELLSTGMPVEYFVEGGRSRTGRLLQAKPGMLSMTIRGFLKYRKKPVAFIPVYIGYEKLLEGKAYQAQLSGEDKKSETFISSMRSIFRIRGEFGKVYANFSRPIYLNDLLDEQHPSWSSEVYLDAERPKWLFDVVNKTSQQIMNHINQAVTINPVNIVSTILLATSKQHMDESELTGMIDIYMSMIQSIDYSDKLILTEMDAEQQIKYVESLSMVKRREHPIGDILFLDNRQAISMTYYRNNILHVMALPSIIACCFFNVRSQTREEITSLVSLTYPFIQKELFLVWDQNQLPDVISKVLNMMSDLGLLIKNEQMDVFTRPGSGAKEFTQLTLLARVISPLLEIYYLTLALLSRSGSDKVSRKELENRCYLMAQRVAMIHELNAPDFSDKHLISNFINTLIHIDYLTVYDTEHLEYSEVFHKADRRIHLLLTKEMRSNILQMLKIEK
jgi:glycerol-3-phosphate O-acyltransferase